MPRKPKYAKTQIETWKCDKCEFVWYYKTMRCPLCASIKLIRMN